MISVHLQWPDQTLRERTLELLGLVCQLAWPRVFAHAPQFFKSLLLCYEDLYLQGIQVELAQKTFQLVIACCSEKNQISQFEVGYFFPLTR